MVEVVRALKVLASLQLVLLLAQSVASDCHAAKIENVAFPTNSVAHSAGNVIVKAKLYLPDHQTGALSAVIIAPSSGGIHMERETYYAHQLADVGIAALVIDSFGSRGLTNSLYDQGVLDEWECANDAVAGLGWLAADRRFQSRPIGIMGVSKGGTVARDTALQVRRTWMGMTDLAFAAHVAISPDCTWVNRSTITTGAPILFMLAERDDQTPAAACVDYAERLRRAGNSEIEVRVYYGTHHGWEQLGERPLFDPRAENYSRCRVWIEDDGTMFADGSGHPIPERGWHAWAKRHCMSLGTHCCGGTPELKRQATDDLIAFLKKHNF